MRYKVYGQKVKELRKEKGLSQKAFAKIIELPYMTLRRLEEKNSNNEKGLSRYTVDEKSIEKISYHLETPFEEFVSNETKERMFYFIKAQRVLLQEVRLYVKKEFGFEIQDEQIIPFLYRSMKQNKKISDYYISSIVKE
tara:strand:- start:23 stop:439 length:417 start_codon:yes stop_codon:yes gene_type:complete